jgi:peroxiredoxin
MRPVDNTLAPNFSLTDTHDRTINLSDYLGKKAVVLVFNRGFA